MDQATRLRARRGFRDLKQAKNDTTRLYDRRRMRPEDSPTFKVAY